ncbi:MAG: flagellar biosynthesis protein FlhA [Acidobacteria bacterium]|nr:flagellar biosynthesis protein FlhA [Acidobacteriota bacterium]
MNSSRIGAIGIPAAVVAVVVMMVVPLPAIILDLLLVVNITFAVLVLLVSMQVHRALDFAVFPSMLLVATMFRLALNVSATRLVLLHGYAGKVIQSFGHFVVGGSVVVGLVVFLILIVIQFIVVTNGAGRVAEVGARFTLDAMPGKQMAIDADLNAGLIDEKTALKRRMEVGAEADFYGAMDGASKFVKGDAIAAIVITFINLFGGFIVGVVQKHMPISDAISTYSLLSIGDGLVSQIPALLISISTGIIVTRATTDGDLGTDLLGQFGRQKRSLQIGGIAVATLALIPGIPKVPFLLVGGSVYLISRRLPNPDEIPEVVEEALDGPPPPSPDSPEGLAPEMRVEPLELEIAYDLVELVDPSRGGDLLDRVRALRRKLAIDLGMVIPLVRTRDNLELPPSTYVIRVHGVETGRGEAPPGTVLAIADDLDSLPGTPTVEPVFGLAAKWVPFELRQQAELAGATVVDRSSVITTHLAEVVRDHAGRLLGRSDVKSLVEMVRASDPVVVEDLIPGALGLGEIQRVLQLLLDESVAIRDLVRIFEAMGERARSTKDPEALVEAVRGVLGPAISAQWAVDGRLPAITFEPLVEHSLLEALRAGDNGTFLAIEPAQAERIAMEVAARAEEGEQAGDQPVLLCSAPLRPAVRRLVRAAAPRLPVLSYAELGSQLRVETIGVITLAQHAEV